MAQAPQERWAEIERLLDQALDLPPADRPAFLERACAGDLALRAEVESVLRATQAVDTFLNEPASAYAAPLLAGVAERQALAPGEGLGSYRIERELGHGGMATVYLAQDVRHSRQVAIKVLAPELALAVRTERFLREIAIAAQLTHPHILPVHDSGQADGFLYYVMPHVEGESLKERLDREGPLPQEEAVQIACEVADALTYAHDHGVIHRDIKPGNILLQSGHAVVADFGIARAVSAAGKHDITDTGVSLGTPAYMSPEQASGVPVDARSDIYSLGCVLYEMLEGRPPFPGPAADAIRAHHIADPVPPLSRPDVPARVQATLTTALAKRPTERFATAAEFAAALEPGAVPRRRPLRVGPYAAILTAALVVAASIGVWRWRTKVTGASIEPDVVAVLPFRVNGATPELRALREGMVDLLATKLTGEGGGPRARDPRTVLSAWRREVGDTTQDLDEHASVRLARQLGAGRLLLGGVIETSGRLVISAALLDVPGGAKVAAANLSGPSDSLVTLVNQLAAQLLARAAGVEEQRLGSLTSQSLPAVQAYLAGQAAIRDGRLQAAVDQFDRALQLDSTFALAAMYLATWSGRSGQPERLERGATIAYRYRGRLSPRDQLLLPARINGYDPQRVASVADFLASLERSVVLAPDRAEAWDFLGTGLSLFAPLLGSSAPDARAAAALRRALELDPSFELPLFRLVDLAVEMRDTAEARRAVARYLTLHPTSDFADYASWRVAMAVGDSLELGALRARFDSIPRLSLRSILGIAQLDGRGLDDAERAAQVLRRLPATRGAQWGLYRTLYQFALNRGRPAEAVAIAQAMRDVEPARGNTYALEVLAALFWDGDTTAGVAAAAELARLARAPLSPDARAREGVLVARCLIALWNLAHGERATTTRVLGELRSPPGAAESPAIAAIKIVCRATLETERGLRESGTQSAAGVHVLDSVVAVGGAVGAANYGGTMQLWLGVLSQHIPHLEVARVREARGDLMGALDAVRRRLRGPFGGPQFLSTYLGEEGRLAALSGDRAGAIRAYQHYLALRSDPEPSLRPEVERVRAEVTRLRSEQR